MSLSFPSTSVAAKLIVFRFQIYFECPEHSCADLTIMSPGELSDHWGDSDDDADLLASAEVAERNEKYMSVAQSYSQSGNTKEKEGEEEEEVEVEVKVKVS